MLNMMFILIFNFSDPITNAIGNIGKWQWLIILPLAIREIFSSWQMLSPPFLAMEPKNYYCNESGTENFENLQKWQDFANVANSDGTIDKCMVYDLDYTNYDVIKDALNGSQLTDKTRSCSSWVFPENTTQSLITDVSYSKKQYLVY